MPFDGSGNFSRSYSWQSDRDNGIRILASRMDGEFDNFAGGMNQVFFRNGLVPMSGNLNLGQNSIIGLASGTTNALPIRFGDDPGSGMFLPGVGRLGFATGGTNRLEVNNTGVAVTGNMVATATVQGNDVRVGANPVWHAGNFTPGNYAALTGATFSGAVIAPLVHALTANGNGSIRLVGNGASTFTGFVEFLRGNGVTREAYIGNAAVGGPLEYSAENGHNFLNKVNVAGNITQSGNAVWHAGNFNPSSYAALSGATFTGDITTYRNAAPNTGVVYLTKDGSKYLFFDGVDYNLVSASLRVGQNVIAGGTVTGASVTVGGNPVWHSGNFAPGNYAALNSGPTFTGRTTAPAYSTSGDMSFFNGTTGRRWYAVNDADVLRLLDNGGNVRYSFDSAALSVSGQLNVGTNVIAGATIKGNAVQVGDNPVWHSGNFTPGNYAALNSAPSFSGVVTATSFTTTVNAASAINLSDRTTANAAWSIYAQNQILRTFYGGADLMTINTAGVVTTVDQVRSGAGRYAYQSQAGLSAAMSRGTANPSGGSDGDMYFQYT